MPCFPIAVIALLVACGCSDDTDLVRQIQSQRQEKMQTQTKVDHIGEAFSLLSRLVELNPEQAQRQITYHLNQWSEERAKGTAEVTELVKTIRDILPSELVAKRIESEAFRESDVGHLRDTYLFSRIASWVDRPHSDDPLLANWWDTLSKTTSESDVDKLKTASRLFDWTVRNIAYESRLPKMSAPPQPDMSAGMKFQGVGYRQTDYLTVWRGTGDFLQRAGVFTQLCRQVSIPAFVLAMPSPESGELNPWCVGVLIGKEIYLFEPELAVYIPGPGQVGIATLAQARQDASVLRRLNAPGFFEYPYSKSDVQQCVALLNAVPEAISPRMQMLESGLTGGRRMITYVDADKLAERIDASAGIAGVRLWDVPVLAEIYQQDMEKAAKRDPIFNFWYLSRWAILDAETPSSRDLSLGRWRHLLGQFENDDVEDTKGARALYLTQRAPEFEIEDLRIDVELQKSYGIRRELGISSDVYDRQVQQMQAMMRQGKDTATYWISLIQFEDQRFETAKTWFSKRVLAVGQSPQWHPAARYNLARTEEMLGNLEAAETLYKTDKDPQEHGNRIRARLLSKSTDEE